MHLRVLREAGLVAARTEGTRRPYQLEPDALAALRDHLDWYWTQALEKFRQHVEAEGEEPMEADLKVTKSTVVDAPLVRAFQLFVDQARWWPVATHDVAELPGETVVLEPFPGGRWYERSRDGSETDWGRVLAFEPPRRILLSWQVSPEWRYEPDPARASEIDVRFSAEDEGRTRIVLGHRHLERYGDQAEGMRAILDRPHADAALLAAYAAAVTVANAAATGALSHA